MNKEALIDITAESTGEVVVAVASSVVDGGFGTLPSSIIALLAKNGLKEAMNKVHDDVLSRQLSALQSKRAKLVSNYAQTMFYQKIQTQGWQPNHPEGDLYIQSLKEAYEHAIINAMNESREKKIPFEGYLLATQMASQNDNFEDYYMMANIMAKMSWRQMVLVAIIKSEWNGYDQSLFITNPAACVEAYDLLLWGLVRPDTGWIIENNSAPIKLKVLSITELGKQFYESAVLSKISEEDKNCVCRTLQIQELDIKEPSNRLHYASNEQIQRVKDRIR